MTFYVIDDVIVFVVIDITCMNPGNWMNFKYLKRLNSNTDK